MLVVAKKKIENPMNNGENTQIFIQTDPHTSFYFNRQTFNYGIKRFKIIAGKKSEENRLRYDILNNVLLL